MKRKILKKKQTASFLLKTGHVLHSVLSRNKNIFRRCQGHCFFWIMLCKETESLNFSLKTEGQCFSYARFYVAALIKQFIVLRRVEYFCVVYRYLRCGYGCVYCCKLYRSGNVIHLISLCRKANYLLNRIRCSVKLGNWLKNFFLDLLVNF